MIHWRRTACITLIACSAALAAPVGPQTRPATVPAADALTVLNVDGKAIRPLDLGESKAAVFLFIRTDCPISNSYTPEVLRICQAYAARGVRFHLVHADPDLTAAEARKHAEEFGLSKAPCTLLMDGKRTLVRTCGVRVTPEAAIIDPAGKVVYRGRIDDKWLGYGKSRAEPTVRDLRVALDAVLSGKPAPAARARAVGCPIE